MLEKIGLPPKPSLRGNNWVVDASHCQGCSSQFTFINRKHHCRRCGGLFCNNCSRERMVLRGQGDSQVRICEPCKKLEEAARYEMRHGHKNRGGRGGSKRTFTNEDDVLNMILANDGKESVLSGRDSSIQRSTTGASCSNIQEATSQKEGEEIIRSYSVDMRNNVSTEMGSATPEVLRQEAMHEKMKYKILKAEGKSEEALRAFKRGKELERQAGALELQLRKNRKKALSSITMNEIEQIKDDPGESNRKNRHSPQMSKGKDDLGAELRELGWSDVDIRDADKKPAIMSLEGELTNLLGEDSQKTNTETGTRGIDKSQVIAHKKMALALKREGKLAEAKEELKRAKVLEKQIEEQEFLVDAEDSDEEFSSLIRSMDIDKQDVTSITNLQDPNFNFDHFTGIADGLDSNFEVTDEDMDDPEITSALNSIGWTEDTNHPDDMEALSSKIQSLKREALNEKRAGNTAEAVVLLKKAKVFEKDLESYDSQVNNLITHNPAMGQKDSVSSYDENSLNTNGRKDMNPQLAPKSKLMIQKELLGVKKRALALRREGRIVEADEELKKGKGLEQQLEEMDTASQVKVTQTNFRNKHSADKFAALDVGYEEEDVTDQDMHDPSYLSVLKNLGWNDENNENVRCPPRGNDSTSVQSSESSVGEGHTGIQIVASRRSKGEIQRELLGLKRKSLALRRQGDTEEAEEVLKMARHLEAQLDEMEVPKQEVPTEFNKHKNYEVVNFPLKNAADAVVRGVLLEEDIPSASSQKSSPRSLGSNDEVTYEKIEEIADASEGMVPQTNQSSLKQEIMTHKRKAVVLKREGKLVEAKEELRQAKLLEKSLEDENPKPSTNFSDVSSSKIASVGQKENSLSAAPRSSSRDRFKLQQESLSHKRQALKLRREGRMEEAEAEFELAKALETQLEEITTHDSSKSSVNAAESVDDVGIEDLLDPQLLAALKAIGLEDANILSHGPQRPESVKSVAGKIEKSSQERIQMEEQIKLEKVKAVSLKRSGKQAEALDALRRAKVLEKKLNSPASQ